jgi:hypothetical protein
MLAKLLLMPRTGNDRLVGLCAFAPRFHSGQRMLFEMRLEAKHFYDVRLLQNLIHEAVLNIDATRVRASKITHQLLVRSECLHDRYIPN